MCCSCRETHSNQADKIDWSLWWQGRCVLSHGTDSSAGVAVLFKTTASATVLSSYEVVRGRQAEIHSSVFCFVNVYAPNHGAERVRFFNLLKNELRNYHQDLLITGGDFNCTLDSTSDRTSEEPHPQSAQSLNNIIAHLDLLDTRKVKHPQSRQYTRARVSNNRVCAARLDRIYISQSLSSRLIHCHINPAGFTDHHLVNLHLKISPGGRVQSYWLFSSKLLQDTTFCQHFQFLWKKWKLRK